MLKSENLIIELIKLKKKNLLLYIITGDRTTKRLYFVLIKLFNIKILLLTLWDQLDKGGLRLIRR